MGPKLMSVLERASRLKGLRFETEPAGGGREVQSMLDRNGRIVGWFSWEPERPATAMMSRLMPLVGFIAVGVAGFAALAMWQLGRLGLLLAKSEQHVQKLGYEDILTGLPNHDHFFELLDRAIAKRHGTELLAFAALDLDGFDEINDALGYSGGDEVLAEIGKRLRDALPPSAAIARLGSDEFALMITGKNAEAAVFIADTVRQALARPIWDEPVCPGRRQHRPCRCAARRHQPRRAHAPRRSRIAGGQAPRPRHDRFVRGRDGSGFPGAAFYASANWRTRSPRDAFDVHYQPIVKADGGAIAGVEALLRWHHPTRGPIPPSVFVPVAEEGGFMDKLGEFVLRRAVSDAARWPDLYVSVNLSPVQVRNRAFVERSRRC